MRRSPTRAEALLWEQLRGNAFGVRFRRQHATDRFIVDFYCPAARLVIEVDGPMHDATKEQDAAKDAELTALGLRVLRLTSDDVLERLPTALARIRQALAPPQC